MTLEQAIFSLIAVPMFSYLMVQFAFFVKNISK